VQEQQGDERDLQAGGGQMMLPFPGEGAQCAWGVVVVVVVVGVVVVAAAAAVAVAVVVCSAECSAACTSRLVWSEQAGREG
jgi:hypothetical protein